MIVVVVVVRIGCLLVFMNWMNVLGLVVILVVY